MSGTVSSGVPMPNVPLITPPMRRAKAHQSRVAVLNSKGEVKRSGVCLRSRDPTDASASRAMPDRRVQGIGFDGLSLLPYSGRTRSAMSFADDYDMFSAIKLNLYFPHYRTICFARCRTALPMRRRPHREASGTEQD